MLKIFSHLPHVCCLPVQTFLLLVAHMHTSSMPPLQDSLLPTYAPPLSTHTSYSQSTTPYLHLTTLIHSPALLLLLLPSTITSPNSHLPTTSRYFYAQLVASVFARASLPIGANGPSNQEVGERLELGFQRLEAVFTTGLQAVLAGPQTILPAAVAAAISAATTAAASAAQHNQDAFAPSSQVPRPSEVPTYTIHNVMFYPPPFILSG